MIKSTVVLLVRFYQIFVSPLNGPVCRFDPSCSNYFLEAIDKHGLARGAYLFLRRFIRCHPFCYGGPDPVP